NDSELKTFKEYNLIQDQKYFFNLLQDMSTNGIPTFGILRNASLILQQAFYISLVNYFNNSNFENDRTFVYGTSVLWSEKRFNQDILIDKGVWNGKMDENMETYEKFNLFQNNSIYNNYEVMIQSFEKILSKTSDKNFDFFHDEIEFINNLIWFKPDYFNYLFKKANRIVILCDGSYHANDFIPNIESILNNHKTTRTREETIQLLKDLREGKIESLTKDDVLDVLLLKNYETTKENSNFNFVSLVSYDANIFNASSLNNNKQYNESAFSTNFVDYKNYINVDENKQKYLDVYSKLFISSNLTKEEIFINGVDNYDPKKKNAIFIGSGLFRPLSGTISETNFSRLTSIPKVLNEIQNTFKSFLEKYNPNEYNIIFKLHPIFSNVNDPNNLAAINYVKLISNNLITDPIIVSSSIPLETWISLDYNNFLNNQDDSIIFRQSNDVLAKEWTIFFGLQATSTTVHTTRLFYQTSFNLNKNEVAELIPFSNFPIGKSYSISHYMTEDTKKDYTKENEQSIANIYKVFCPSITYYQMDKIDNLSKYDSIVLNF
ncbi:MAG: hypothetical protein K2I49_00580, partial [Ureaplasma sp.]|nr:hypothetical protein [Ureaplasma sp.]